MTHFVEPNEIWESRFEIASYHMDPFGFLKLSSLFELLQDAASRDAARKGFGYHELMKNKRYWVLLRALIRVNRLPRWEEQVSFQTWPKESTGAVAFRDFVLEDGTGGSLLQATSTWSQLHAESRRPVRIEVGSDYHPVTTRHAITERAGKVSLPASMHWSDPLVVQYSHIDVNKHINNARYLEWVLNELPFEWLEKNSVSEVEVNFLSEGMLGDPLRIGWKIAGADTVFGCVAREPDQKPLYAVRLSFRGRT